MPATPEPLVRDYRFKARQNSYARDIDTYVRPQQRQIAAPTGPTEAERLALSLRELSPILQNYLEKQENRKKAELIAEGERLQKESAVKDWNEYVRQHPEHEKYNPWLREGFEKQAVIAYGADFKTYMQETVATDETLAAMTDPAQIDEYLSEKTAEYMRNNLGHLNDRAVQQQFTAFANQTRAAIASQFVNKRLDEQLKEKYDAYQTGVINIADSFIVGNMETLTTADDATVDAMAAQLAAQLSIHAENTILDVSNPKRVNDATIEAALTWLSSLAPEYFDFGQQVVENLTGRDGAKLIGVARYQKAYEEVKKNTWSAYMQKERDRAWLENEEERKWANAAADEYYETIAANPLADHTSLVIEAGHKYGPLAQERVRSWASANFSAASARYNFFKNSAGQGGADYDDVKAYLLLQRAADGELTETEILDAVRDNIFTPKEAIFLREQAKNPNPEETVILKAAMNTTFNAAGLPEKAAEYTSDDLKTVYSIEADYRHELMLYKMEYRSKNGSSPGREEIQQHFIKYAEEKNKAVMEAEQARLKREQEAKAYEEDLEKRAKTLNFTSEQFHRLMNDYLKNGSSSVITQLKASSGALATRLSDETFIIELARRSGVPLNELTARYGITPPPPGTPGLREIYQDTVGKR